MVIKVSDYESNQVKAIYDNWLLIWVSLAVKNAGKIIVYSDKFLFNTYSMKQPDLYCFETIKMTSQALSNFVYEPHFFSKRLLLYSENSQVSIEALMEALLSNFIWRIRSTGEYSL